MTALTAPVEDGVRDYLWTPVNFGEDSEKQRLAEADAFRAGVAWGQAHTDGRVLAGLVPGQVEARLVQIGDHVRILRAEARVITKREHGRPGYVYLGIRTEGGAEIVHELRTTERVHVLSGATAA